MQDGILPLLADGRFHSGEALARELGCSRAAVWKRLQALRERTGLEVQAVTGKGYRLARPLELLEEKAIVEAMGPVARARLRGLHLYDETTSTNALAAEGLRAGELQPAAWLAEYQTAGRGRRGRRWHSPYGRNLYLSLLYSFDLPMQQLSGLSIAMGVVLAELLARHGLHDHGLKWPNDLHWRGHKLAGLLVEAIGETAGPVHAIIGIGLNLDLGNTLPDWIDQPAGDLRMAGLSPSRNRLAGELIDALLVGCSEYAQAGLRPFLPRWEAFDLYRGQPVRLSSGAGEWRGLLLGLSANGGVRLQTDEGERVFHGGELSLRGEAR